ncbi:hypothetical protein EB118_10695 [bacterium]|nr:hypothetical protein [bacterium]NDD83201.1 hypothetical protein [bacterium]NDG30525.1 hypothetical protein [bacterium]
MSVSVDVDQVTSYDCLCKNKKCSCKVDTLTTREKELELEPVMGFNDDIEYMSVEQFTDEKEHPQVVEFYEDVENFTDKEEHPHVVEFYEDVQDVETFTDTEDQRKRFFESEVLEDVIDMVEGFDVPVYNSHRTIHLMTDDTNKLLSGTGDLYIGKTQARLDLKCHLYTINANVHDKYNESSLYTAYLVNNTTKNKLKVGDLARSGDQVYKLTFVTNEPTIFQQYDTIVVDYYSNDTGSAQFRTVLQAPIHQY